MSVVEQPIVIEPWMGKAMARAVKLSQRGFPAPNPRVGCVIVNKGQVVGEGFHAFAGGPHAEVEALLRAREGAKGADVFVTLEPCNHFGKTPPCAQALIQAGVKRVFYAVSDPNPVASGGADTLMKAGINAFVGLGAEAARKVNGPWLVATARQSPYVAVKCAMSLDGRIALPSGQSQWITNDASRRAGRRLRTEYGAILVGRKTVEADNPRLTARIKGVTNEPVRLILDPHQSLNDELPLFQGDHPARRVVAKAVLPGDIEVPLHAGGFVLPLLLKALYASGIQMVLVEGGAHTVSRFLEAQVVDRIHLFAGNCILGDGTPWATFANQSLDKTQRWHLDGLRRHGDCFEATYDSSPV